MKYTVPCLLMVVAAGLYGLDQIPRMSAQTASGNAATLRSGLRRAWPVRNTSSVAVRASDADFRRTELLLSQVSADFLDRKASYDAQALEHSLRQSQLDLMRTDLVRERLEIERLKAQIDAQVDGGLRRATTARKGEIPGRAAIDRPASDIRDSEEPDGLTGADSTTETPSLDAAGANQQRILAEVYRGMTPEGVATVVSDLVSGGHMDGAARVLSLLEDRKAARVLSIVATPQPDAASALARRLQDSHVH